MKRQPQAAKKAETDSCKGGCDPGALGRKEGRQPRLASGSREQRKCQPRAAKEVAAKGKEGGNPG